MIELVRQPGHATNIFYFQHPIFLPAAAQDQKCQGLARRGMRTQRRISPRIAPPEHVHAAVDIGLDDMQEDPRGLACYVRRLNDVLLLEEMMTITNGQTDVLSSESPILQCEASLCFLRGVLMKHRTCGPLRIAFNWTWSGAIPCSSHGT